MNRCFRIALLAATVAGIASGDVFTDRVLFVGTNPGLSLMDFEGIAPPDDFVVLPGYSSMGVTFVNGGQWDDPTIVSATVSSAQFGGVPAPSDYMLQSWNDTPLGFTFSEGVEAVGFNVIAFSLFDPTNEGLPVQIQAFHGASLLASIELDSNSLDLFDTFIGFSNLGNSITSIMVTKAGTYENTNVGIDNLYFGNPVPAPATTVILSIGGLWSRRRGR